MAFVGATISRPRADTIRPYKTDDSKKARGNMNCSALFYARRAWRSFSMALRSSRETAIMHVMLLSVMLILKRAVLEHHNL